MQSILCKLLASLDTSSDASTTQTYESSSDLEKLFTRSSLEGLPARWHNLCTSEERCNSSFLQVLREGLRAFGAGLLGQLSFS